MDTSEDVGFLVHKLCGEKAYILAHDPPSEKLLMSHIRCDVHGKPVHPGALYCPNCNGRIRLSTVDLDVYVKEKRINGHAVAD